MNQIIIEAVKAVIELVNKALSGDDYSYDKLKSILPDELETTLARAKADEEARQKFSKQGD